jgi:hypothetical protein
MNYEPPKNNRRRITKKFLPPLPFEAIQNGGFGIRSYSSLSPTKLNANASAGDVCWNSNPTFGSPISWKCIASGNPGTWIAIGYLT